MKYWGKEKDYFWNTVPVRMSALTYRFFFLFLFSYMPVPPLKCGALMSSLRSCLLKLTAVENAGGPTLPTTTTMLSAQLPCGPPNSSWKPEGASASQSISVCSQYRKKQIDNKGLGSSNKSPPSHTNWESSWGGGCFTMWLVMAQTQGIVGKAQASPRAQPL